MKKYLNYITFLMIIFLTLCFSVSALDCYYQAVRFGKKFNAHFRINENSNTIVFSGISGDYEGIHAEGETQKVENWNKMFKPITESTTVSDFVGADYYSEKKDCPPLAFLVDRKGQYDLVVSDKEHQNDFLNYAAKKQGYVPMALVPQNSDGIVTRYPVSCLGLNKGSCENNENFACIWVDKEDYDFLNKSYCNVDNLLYVSCGGASDIPMQVPSIISMLVNLLKIATPIILIVISMIALVKALAAGKEDEIKKATSSLVKKMIAAALVFFVVAIVQFVISKVAEDDEYKEFDDCLNCFLNNSCSENMYYKTVISGQDWCTDLTTGNSELCNPDE